MPEYPPHIQALIDKMLALKGGTETLLPDALQTVPQYRGTTPAGNPAIGRTIGTQPGPETYTHPGANSLQNLMLAVREGASFPLPDFGEPKEVWDPRLLGLITGTIAVLEPGPGGEMKGAKAGSEVVVGTAVKLKNGKILAGPQTHRASILEYTMKKAADGADSYDEVKSALIPEWSHDTFGFITNKGRYLTPQEAGPIAYAAGQIGDITKRRRTYKGKWIDLWSEDIRKPWLEGDFNKMAGLGNEAVAALPVELNQINDNLASLGMLMKVEQNAPQPYMIMNKFGQTLWRGHTPSVGYRAVTGPKG